MLPFVSYTVWAGRIIATVLCITTSIFLIKLLRQPRGFPEAFFRPADIIEEVLLWWGEGGLRRFSLVSIMIFCLITVLL